MRDHNSFPWFWAMSAASVIGFLLHRSVFLEGKNVGLSEALDKKPAVSVEQNIQMGVNRYKSQTTTDCVERPECDPLFGGGQ